jgi:hypothetical protein
MPLRGCAVPQNLSILIPIHDLPCDLFAVVVGVAEHDLGRFGAFVIKLQVVFPGESDAAVNLCAAGASLSTSPVELAKPPEAPKDSAAGFLTRWDSWILLANFGELVPAAITLIFIRNRSAMTNTPCAFESLQVSHSRKAGCIAQLFCVMLRGIFCGFRLSKWRGWLLYTNYTYLYRQAEWDCLPTQPAGPQQSGNS